MRCFSNDLCSPGSKSRLAKAAGAQVAVQRRNEKLRAAVARSTFASKNAKKLTFSDRFLKLGCGKLARRFSEKHVCKSKCTKHLRFGTLLEVPISKRCPPEEIGRLILS